MQTTTTFTVDATKEIAICGKPSSGNSYIATVYVYGTFGSGTVTIQASPDGGTTKFTIKDKFGASISLTSDGIAVIELGGGYTAPLGAAQQPELLYATLTGSTSPTLTIKVNDNWSE